LHTIIGLFSYVFRFFNTSLDFISYWRYKYFCKDLKPRARAHTHKLFSLIYH